MKRIGWALFATVFIFFLSLIVIAPIISNIGYSSVEGSYHAATHAILISLLFTVIVCTMMIMEEINLIKEKLNGDKKV
ncbi:hypothetical protein [Desulfotomaculum sp. 1211_IL3151]|uniref:hypothetical protein n=1 Tax=Desulfotomaculum sp. 1211_IL3151 TaxID=3084055 RepID=UPI002FDB5EF5